MFKNFKQVSVKINNQDFIVDEAQLSNEITVVPKYTVESRTSKTELANSLWMGNLKLNYYLTGFDYLKQYIYTNEYQPISGNIAGLMFNQGYVSNYSLNIQPNEKILVNANIVFFDQLTGTFNNTSSTNKTGLTLRTSDITFNNLSSYSDNLINFITRANFDYTCSIKPSYNYYDTGILPTRADNISIEERIISTEINSDNTIFNLPLSGEKFGIIFTFSNPNNTGIYETFGCSGIINSKSLSLNTLNPHNHTIKIIQHHINSNEGLSGVVVSSNQILINSTDGSHPFYSKDNNLNYVEKIFVGDTVLTGYSTNRFSSYDQILSPVPLNISDDILTIQTSYGNFIWPPKLHFTYPNITITGLSQYTGNVGTNITISGTNFYRISDVLFGGNTEAQFQVIDPQTIITTIPNNGISNPIIVCSNSRAKSGISPSGFFYSPFLTNIIPTTGLWKDTITVSGKNFTGVTGVYFNNNITSFSFSILNNNLVNVRVPETGNGFPSGCISFYGTGGYGQSIPVYNPIVPIYSFSPLSGAPNTGITIFTKIDTGYLFPFPTVYTTGYNSTSYIIPTGLLLWYGFDGTLNDYSIHNNTGIINGGINYIPDNNNFPVCALYFNGNEYLVPSFDPFGISYPSGFSISTWWSGGNQNSFFLGRGGNDSNTAGWSIQMGNFTGAVANKVGSNNFYYYVGMTGLTTGWNNTVLTYDPNKNLTIYFNGKSGNFTKITGGTSLRDDTIGLQIGKNPVNGSFFTGGLNDVKIFNFPLSSGQIFSNYTGNITYNQPFSGFINIASGGYKVKIGGFDTRFFISGTGILTGLLPFNSNDDFIYIYGPDGNLTYSSSQQFNVIGFPRIDYISPYQTNQYTFFNMLLVGDGFKFFSNQPYFFSISGGLSGDMQTYSTNHFSSSLGGNTMIVNNINVTGATGYYDIFVQNVVSGYKLVSGLLIIPPINQSQNCTASFNNSSAIFPVGEASDTFRIAFSKFFNLATSCIDLSAETFAVISNPTTTPSGQFITISPVSVPSLNVSTIRINSSGWFTGFTAGQVSLGAGFTPLPPGFANDYTGSVAIYRGTTQLYNSPIVLMSGGTVFTPTGLLTGVTKINIYPEFYGGNANYYGLPLSEVEIY